MAALLAVTVLRCRAFPQRFEAPQVEIELQFVSERVGQQRVRVEEHGWPASRRRFLSVCRICLIPLWVVWRQSVVSHVQHR